MALYCLLTYIHLEGLRKNTITLISHERDNKLRTMALYLYNKYTFMTYEKKCYEFNTDIVKYTDRDGLHTLSYHRKILY